MKTPALFAQVLLCSMVKHQEVQKSFVTYGDLQRVSKLSHELASGSTSAKSSVRWVTPRQR